jgi:hypothetical protein
MDIIYTQITRKPKGKSLADLQVPELASIPAWEGTHMDDRVQRANSRAFISFWLYLFLTIWLTMIGVQSRNINLHAAAAFLTLGAAFTVSLYFKHVRLVHQQLMSPHPRWETGKAMTIGVWLMAGIGVMSLWFTA